jgi:hypothetical protein
MICKRTLCLPIWAEKMPKKMIVKLLHWTFSVTILPVKLMRGKSTLLFDEKKK